MIIVFVLLLLILIPYCSGADMMIGGEVIYVVEKGDILELIGAKLGVDWRRICKENDIDPKKPLKIGQEIKVNNRKIVPKIVTDGIIINIPDRMLYFFKKVGYVHSPLASGCHHGEG